ncbi:hypothetical protein SAMN02745866_03947 [Alteromonadaceae bacterium Bs31]|nr:hypothetical protein SAMN02745866_03947 [Alteromonadaceae bacterium Bs31]
MREMYEYENNSRLLHLVVDLAYTELCYGV